MNIGSFNRLAVLRRSPRGLHLDGGDAGEILLPARQAPESCSPGTVLDVFVYSDSEDRLTATMQTPLAQVGEVAWLKVVSTGDAGTFLDWGLPKDLLLPWSEQPRELRSSLVPGRHCMVMVFVDDDGRIAASARLDDFIAPEATEFTQGQEVGLTIANRTEIGVRVVVNNRYWGLLYSDEIFQPLRQGERRTGYVKKLRTDHRLDITLTPPGRAAVSGIAQEILDQLARNGGFMAVSDNSTPELVHRLFGVSKKVFKQAIGTLYRERRILIDDSGIRLVQPET
jgi:predicted RNA-binding protein (virulence factor B family)